MSSEITGKIEEVTGKEIAEIKASEVTETAVKEAPKNQVTASSQGNSGSSSSSSKSSNSGNKPSKSNNSSTGSVNKPSEKPKPSKPSNPSTPSKPSKKWVVDKPAWTETINHPATYKTVTKYRTEQDIKYYYGGKTYDTYEEGYAQYAKDGDEGNPKGSLSPITVDVQVPYQEQIVDKEAWTETINHPEEGHWE